MRPESIPSLSSLKRSDLLDPNPEMSIFSGFILKNPRDWTTPTNPSSEFGAEEPLCHLARFGVAAKDLRN
jgi:hypothetical protein